MSRGYTLRDAKQIYDRLRKRYFLDATPPLHLPPAADELRWLWLPANSGNLGETTFDEDGDPEAVALDPMLRESRKLLKLILLHEMTHMRLGSKYSCGGFSHRWSGARIPRSSQWFGETVRLAEAGALQL